MGRLVFVSKNIFLVATLILILYNLGSTDGYVCVFDCSQSDEDEALLGTLNSESAVVGICRWSSLSSEIIYSGHICSVEIPSSKLTLKDTITDHQI